jgi:hypothetical protein
MALKKLAQTPFGVTVQDAYIRVENVQLVAKNQMSFNVRTSVDGVLPHFADVGYECAYDIQGDNPIRQAYKHIKTLPEYAGAVDC